MNSECEKAKLVLSEKYLSFIDEMIIKDKGTECGEKWQKMKRLMVDTKRL